MKRLPLVLAVALHGGAACAHRHADNRAAENRAEGRAEARAEERADARGDHREGGVSRADWTRLGESWVDGVRDRDVISVGARDGTFRRIMIVVEHSALEMYDVVVNFSDGSRFSPPTRLVFRPNSRSQIIDLPGNRRVIRSVEFRYGNLPGGGRAQAELWAQ